MRYREYITFSFASKQLLIQVACITIVEKIVSCPCINFFSIKWQSLCQEIVSVSSFPRSFVLFELLEFYLTLLSFFMFIILCLFSFLNHVLLDVINKLLWFYLEHKTIIYMKYMGIAFFCNPVCIIVDADRLTFTSQFKLLKELFIIKVKQPSFLKPLPEICTLVQMALIHIIANPIYDYN